MERTFLTNVAGENLEYVQKMHQAMRKEQMIFCYRGHFTREIINTILTGSEKNLLKKEDNLLTQKKIFQIMIESLQLICRSEDVFRHERKAFFALCHQEQAYKVLSGSYIKNDNVPRLQLELNEIVNLDKTKQRERHIEMISGSTWDSHVETVLGLLRIARRSGNQLDYHFDQLDDENSFFSITTTIVH